MYCVAKVRGWRGCGAAIHLFGAVADNTLCGKLWILWNMGTADRVGSREILLFGLEETGCRYRGRYVTGLFAPVRRTIHISEDNDYYGFLFT